MLQLLLSYGYKIINNIFIKDFTVAIINTAKLSVLSVAATIKPASSDN